MAQNYDLPLVFKNQFDTVASLAGKLVGNAGKIVNEVQDITVTSMQAQAAFLNKLASARNASDLIQIQTGYAQEALAATLERSKKIGELLAEISRDTVGSVTPGAEQTKTPAKTLSVAKKLQAAE
jgi:hypothetical protein